MESTYVPQALSVSDKLLHGAMYMLLAGCWMFPVGRSYPARVVPYLWVWVGVVGYGALMEVLQRYCTLTRSGDMADLYADAAGAAAGVICVALFLIINRKP